MKPNDVESFDWWVEVREIEAVQQVGDVVAARLDPGVTYQSKHLQGAKVGEKWNCLFSKGAACFGRLVYAEPVLKRVAESGEVRVAYDPRNPFGYTVTFADLINGRTIAMTTADAVLLANELLKMVNDYESR